jgi:hypothetical protein
LHAIVEVFSNNNVTGGIKRCAKGCPELPVPCSTAADAAQVRTVAVPKDLNAMVSTIAHHQVALAIKPNATMRTIELPITTTFAADDAHEACTRSCNHPQLPVPIMAPRQNAGGLPQRMRDGAFASVTHQPRGKRHT